MSKRVIAIDFETHPFGGGRMAPKPVCFGQAEEHDAVIVAGEDMLPQMVELLAKAKDGRALIATFAGSFDFSVVIAKWPELTTAVFEAYAADGVACLRVSEKLLDIAEGRHMRHGGKGQYSLDR